MATSLACWQHTFEVGNIDGESGTEVHYLANLEMNLRLLDMVQK